MGNSVANELLASASCCGWATSCRVVLELIVAVGVWFGNS